MTLKKSQESIFNKGLKSGSKLSIYQLIRRIVMIYILVFISHPYFQVVCLLTTSFANLIYVLHQQPFQERQEFKTECLNEFACFLVFCILFQYINPKMEESLREKLGFCLIGIAGLSIMMNISNQFYSSYITYSNPDIPIHEKHFKLLEKHMENRKKIMKLDREKF